jgi:DNA-binding XRE family transcriptional regulator
VPVACRSFAGTVPVVLQKELGMREVIGFGRRQLDGGKVVKLRKQLEMKQEDLAERAHISVRHLREIERTNKTVKGTTITAIATVLKVQPDEITLPASIEMTRTKMTALGSS